MSILRRSCRFPLLAVLGLASFGVSADAPGFKELKQGYLNMLKESGRSGYESYLKRLDALEKEYVKDKRFALAARVQRERDAASKEMGVLDASVGSAPAGGVKLDESGALVMAGGDAEVGGGVSWDKQQEALTGWTSDRCWARWRLPQNLATGGYEVELTFACAGGSGGEVLVKEDFYTLKRPIEASGSWASFHSVVVGTLRVRSGSQTLQVSAAVTKGDGLFYLKSVRLLPAASSL